MYRKNDFAGVHPAGCFLFYMFAVLCPMFTLHPVILTEALILAGVYAARTAGTKTLRKALLWGIPLLAFFGLMNMLTSHHGETILFFMNGNRITKEAFIRGLLMGLDIESVLIWFLSFQKVMTDEKMIFLFGRWAPKLGLTISMILHYIPVLRKRYGEVHAAEMAMGQEGTGRLGRIRQRSKELSTVVSWSLEKAIDQGDSMEARGYGLPHKTSYARYRFGAEDGVFLALVILSGVLSLLLAAAPVCRAWFYPYFKMAGISRGLIFMMASYLALSALPILASRREERLWKKS